MVIGMKTARAITKHYLAPLAVKLAKLLTGQRNIHRQLKLCLARLIEGRRRVLAALPQPAQINKLLVIKTEQRGDVVLATAALKALRRHFRKAEIVALTGPWGAELLQRHPTVDRVLVFEHPPNAVERGREPTPGERLQLLERLRSEGFDAGIDLTAHPYSVNLLWEAKIPCRAGAAGTGASHRLTHAVAPDLGMHQVERMLAVVTALGAPDINFAPHIPVDTERQTELLQALAAQGLPLDQPYVCLHAGGRGLKRWPAERWAQVAEKIGGDFNLKVVLLAGPDEQEVLQPFQRLIKADKAFLSPAKTFIDSGTVIARARLYLGNDSGLMHLAAAVGVRVVTVFGPTLTTQWRPHGDGHTVVWRELDCREPCWPAVWDEPCLRWDHQCLEKISVEEVWEAISQNLIGNG